MAYDPYKEPATGSLTSSHPPGGGATRVAARVEQAGAAVSGAAEGLLEEIQRQDLARTTQQAVEEVAEVGRAVGVKGGTGKVTQVLEKARTKVEHAAHDLHERGEAVAETARRAVQAPAAVKQDLKKAASAWAGGMVAGASLALAAGALALVGLVVFTVAAIQGLNEAIGRPAGTFLVALVYGVAAGTCFVLARRARERGRKEAAKQVEAAREEVRRVARPMRRALRRERL